jgi:hypothetical protein
MPCHQRVGNAAAPADLALCHATESGFFSFGDGHRLEDKTIHLSEKIEDEDGGENENKPFNLQLTNTTD